VSIDSCSYPFCQGNPTSGATYALAALSTPSRVTKLLAQFAHPARRFYLAIGRWGGNISREFGNVAAYEKNPNHHNRSRGAGPHPHYKRRGVPRGRLRRRLPRRILWRRLPWGLLLWRRLLRRRLLFWLWLGLGLRLLLLRLRGFRWLRWARLLRRLRVLRIRPRLRRARVCRTGLQQTSLRDRGILDSSLHDRRLRDAGLHQTGLHHSRLREDAGLCARSHYDLYRACLRGGSKAVRTNGCSRHLRCGPCNASLDAAARQGIGPDLQLDAADCPVNGSGLQLDAASADRDCLLRQRAIAR